MDFKMNLPEGFFKVIDGRVILWNNASQFYIEIGKGAKGRYKKKHVIVGHLNNAMVIYNKQIVLPGYKKRLRVRNQVIKVYNNCQER